MAPSTELQIFAIEPVPVIGIMQMPVESKDWQIENAEFVLDSDGLKPLTGRDLFVAFGISVSQPLNSVEGRMINSIKIQCPLKKRIAVSNPKTMYSS